MSFDEKKEEETLIYITYGEDGYPKWNSQMTSNKNTERAVFPVLPDHVMPVIFVPGIMGSNLRETGKKYGSTGKDGMAWRPDDAVYTAWIFANKGPAERLTVLDAKKSEVDDRGKISIPGKFINTLDGPTSDIIKNSLKAELHRRKWGTVMLSSYADIMFNLEMNLNRIYDPQYSATPDLARYWKKDIIDFEQKSNKWNKPTEPWGTFIKGYQDLDIEDLKKVGDKYWFPVHGGGYNWLASNEDSGIALAAQADEIIKHYKSLGFICDKVIVVTHSMGGLVARAMCHSSMGAAANIVAGVVHGEQPALGAAAAYKRMHAGFEARWWNLVDLVTARALGWSGKEVTSVFANSPGAMQLLPTKRYPAKWLRIQAEKGKNLLELPESNPYTEIYKIKDKWWRLMTPEWIQPEEIDLSEKNLNKVWDDYEIRVDRVEAFHDKLDEYYHDVTHAHYGVDEDHKAWENITWHLEKRDPSRYEWPHVPPPEVTTAADQAEFVKSNKQGRITIKLGNAESDYRISKPDTPGDGTVPECSGADSASKAKFATKMQGYDHQGSYTNKAVKDVTTYSVIRIAIESC